MMRWLANLFLIILIPGFSHAEPVAVRSGEHGEFSRLVIYNQNPVAWDFGRVEGGFELRLARPEIAFDLDRAFDLIPRTRIAGLQDLGDGRLKITADCECHAKAFVAGGGQVVIDIVSGVSRGDSDPYNAYLDDPIQIQPAKHPDGPAKSLSVARLGLPLFPSRSPPNALTVDRFAASIKTGIPESETSEDDLGNGINNGGSDGAFPKPVDRVRSTELALIEQIGRAAAQGLIDADLTHFEDQVANATEPQIQHPGPSEEPPISPDPVKPLDANDHIAVQTSIDRETTAQQSVVLSTQEGADCFLDEDYSVSAWGGDVEDGADLSKFKPGLLGEFDRPDPDLVNQYIRHLIYLTFGAEARAVARQFRTVVRSYEAIIQMAEIVDHHHVRNAEALAPQMGCDGNTALWAALAQSEITIEPGDQHQGNSHCTFRFARTLAPPPWPGTRAEIPAVGGSENGPIHSKPIGQSRRRSGSGFQVAGSADKS